MPLLSEKFRNRTGSYVYTIEFQKRGLPHMHLLIFLAPEHRIRTAAEVDTVCSAQIPDKETHPLLYETVSTMMLHGPCSEARCIKDGKCSKKFPKQFSEATVVTEDGYPLLARPNNGRTITKQINGQEVVFTNCDVVPYNPYLSAKYHCHINTEVCFSVKSVKYIHKYVYKGHDRATLEVHKNDEVAQYLDARYISAIEACWRIFEFNMHAEQPPVYRLPVHLENQQTVVFDPETVTADQLVNPKDTHLTGWFKANQQSETAHQYTYTEFPEHYVWDKKTKAWKERSRGFAIGRMYAASPASGERFYLRSLLTVVKGEYFFTIS